MTATLTFPSRPEYGVVIDFAIDIGVTVAATTDFTVNIADATATSVTIGYGSANLDVGDLGSLTEKVLNPAEQLTGEIASLPRLE